MPKAAEKHFRGARYFSLTADKQLVFGSPAFWRIAPNQNGWKVKLPNPAIAPVYMIGGPHFALKNVGSFAFDLAKHDGTVIQTIPPTSWARSYLNALSGNEAWVSKIKVDTSWDGILTAFDGDFNYGYRMEEASGDLDNFRGAGGDLVQNGADNVYQIAGKENFGLNDGETNCGYRTGSEVIDWQADFTIAAWFKFATDDSTIQCIGLRADNQAQGDIATYIQYMTTSKKFRITVSDASAQFFQTAETDEAYALDEWHHIAIRYDHSTGDNELWVNGVLRKTIARVHSKNENVRIGLYNIYGGVTTSNGDVDMDEYYIWEAELSDAAMDSLWNYGLGRFK